MVVCGAYGSASICVMMQLANSDLPLRQDFVRAFSRHREDGPRAQMENTTMTKALSKLAQMKLEIIKYHTHYKESSKIENVDGTLEAYELNDKFLIGLARDACYTAHNSLTFKKQQIADTIADLEYNQSEGRQRQAERNNEFIKSRLMPELDELKCRYAADCEVYKELTGGETYFPPKPKPSNNNSKPSDIDIDTSEYLAAIA